MARGALTGADTRIRRGHALAWAAPQSHDCTTNSARLVTKRDRAGEPGRWQAAQAIRLSQGGTGTRWHIHLPTFPSAHHADRHGRAREGDDLRAGTERAL